MSSQHVHLHLRLLRHPFRDHDRHSQRIQYGCLLLRLSSLTDIRRGCPGLYSPTSTAPPPELRLRLRPLRHRLLLLLRLYQQSRPPA